MDWTKVKLKDVAKIRNNRRMPSAKKIANIPMELVSNKYPYCGYELKEKSRIKSYTYCESGDILLAKITPSLENGKQGIVPENIPDQIAFATTEVFPIVPEKIHSLFLYYIFKFYKYRNRIIASMIGTTGRQRATKKSIENLLINIPSYSSEQKAIAEILSTVDEAIQKADEAIKKTERIKQGVMHKLLTEGIGHKEFKKTKIGKIPKEWTITKLHQVTKSITDGKHGDCHNESNSGYYFISAKDIKDGKIIFENARQITKADFEETHKRTKLDVNDILLTNSGSIGKTSLIDKAIPYGRTTFQKSVAILKPLERQIIPKYLYHCLTYNQKRLDFIANGTSQKNLLLRDIRDFRVPLPSLAEQKQLSEIIDLIISLVHKANARKQKLEQIKLGLMNDLLTGKKRVKVN